MGKRANQQRVDELAQQVAELRQLVVRLKAEIARLRTELAAAGGEDVPAADEVGSEIEAAPSSGRKAPPRWVKANVVVVARNKPRRAREPVPGWRRLVPDRQEIHAPSHCPGCANPLSRGRMVRQRQVIVLPPIRAEVVEHVVLQRRCGQCGMVCRGEMPELGEEVGAGRRFGWAVAAQVAVLRTKLRLPLASLQWLFHHVWGLRVSQGALCSLLEEAARAGQDTYDGLLADARASPVVHVDETGWRQDGRNGYIWTVSTPQVRYFTCTQSRAGRVARRLIGDEYEGVVVSDFYAAYDQLDGRHQRCWAHLLRTIHELQTQHPDDEGLAGWAAAVQTLYRRANDAASQAAAQTPSQREATRLAFEWELLALCRAQPVTAHQATLCKRVERYLPELFVFVSDAAVPATNNAAERALRPLVIARKISGGTRSAQGSQTRMILQSLIATWEVRGQNPLTAMQSLLQGQQPSAGKLAPV